MNNNKYIIGIGAKARVGKDTLAKMLKNLFEEDEHNCEIFRLADALKADCQEFLSEKCAMNVWTNDTFEKSQFRELLVWYGKIQRERTHGKYWTSIVEDRIKEHFSSLQNNKPGAGCFYIVPDIRYGFYPEDEIFWLKKNMSGCLINIERVHADGSFFPPVNKDEVKNSEIVRKFADYELTWKELEEEEINGKPSIEAIEVFKYVKKFFKIQ